MPERVIFIGGGHAHFHSISHAYKLLEKGASVTLICPRFFWYSGMTSGIIGGKYTPEQGRIDMARLAGINGVTHVDTVVTHIDASLRMITCGDGSTHEYDVLSLAVGSTIDVPDSMTEAVAIKPLDNILRIVSQIENARPADVLSIDIVGGGASGCEIAANVIKRAEAQRKRIRVRLLTRGKTLLTNVCESAQRKVHKHLESLGVEILLRSDVQRVSLSGTTVNGALGPKADMTVLATGLKPKIPGCDGIAFDDRSGIIIDDHLRSRNDPSVFAGGDCAHLESNPLPRVGVFGIRQGPVIFSNVTATLRGERLQTFIPQQRYLQILNLGNTGLAVWGGFSWLSPLALKWKDAIDTKFIHKHRMDLQPYTL